MANKKQAKKYILVTKRNYNRNVAVRTRLKSALKVAYASISSPNDETQQLVRSAARLIDKTVSKGVIKKGTGSRKKSRLAKAYQKATAA
mgnify:CR=1 FL=1